MRFVEAVVEDAAIERREVYSDLVRIATEWIGFDQENLSRKCFLDEKVSLRGLAGIEVYDGSMQPVAIHPQGRRDLD